MERSLEADPSAQLRIAFGIFIVLSLSIYIIQQQDPNTLDFGNQFNPPSFEEVSETNATLGMMQCMDKYKTIDNPRLHCSAVIGFHLQYRDFPTAFRLMDVVTKELDSKDLFVWESVPGQDEEKFRIFLEDKLNKSWIRNGSISKINQNNSISITNKNVTIVVSISKIRGIHLVDGFKTIDFSNPFRVFKYSNKTIVQKRISNKIRQKYSEFQYIVLNNTKDIELVIDSCDKLPGIRNAYYYQEQPLVIAAGYPHGLQLSIYHDECIVRLMGLVGRIDKERGVEICNTRLWIPSNKTVRFQHRKGYTERNFYLSCIGRVGVD